MQGDVTAAVLVRRIESMTMILDRLLDDGACSRLDVMSWIILNKLDGMQNTLQEILKEVKRIYHDVTAPARRQVGLQTARSGQKPAINAPFCDTVLEKQTHKIERS